MDVPVYLKWLEGTFLANGGKLVILQNRFQHLEDFRNLPTDLIFNCTGLGAKELCDDNRMLPIKGQILEVDPQSNMDWSISADGFYVYPRRYQTVLGGIVEPNIENENVENGVIQLILRGNKRILPNLTLSSVRSTYAGLRPYREGSIRLEAEEIGNQKIIHNYGHGGSGYTLSWGSAELALALI